MKIEYHPEVERELKEIRNYYKARVPGLGRDFVHEFERQVLRIAATPKRWMIAWQDTRRCLMKRFPYVVYFREIQRDKIRIVLVKHQRRHPGFGRDRR